MPRSLIERRLMDVSGQLERARAELSMLDDQLAVFNDAADETRIRALVSETPLAEREHRDAQKHADAMARSRAAVASSVLELERLLDELLDRLLAESR
jgi:hypothetical protein